jgi:hypothetical protein
MPFSSSFFPADSRRMRDMRMPSVPSNLHATPQAAIQDGCVTWRRPATCIGSAQKACLTGKFFKVDGHSRRIACEAAFRQC